MIPRMRPGVLVASRAIRTTIGPFLLVSCRKHIGGTGRNQAPGCPVGSDVADLDFAGATLGDVQLDAVGIDVDAVGILQPIDDLRCLTGGIDAIHRAAMPGKGVQYRRQRRVQPRDRRRLQRDRILDLALQATGQTIHHRLEDVALAREMEIRRALGAIRRLNDVVHRGFVIALAAKHVLRCVQQQPPRLIRPRLPGWFPDSHCSPKG